MLDGGHPRNMGGACIISTHCNKMRGTRLLILHQGEWGEQEKLLRQGEILRPGPELGGMLDRLKH